MPGYHHLLAIVLMLTASCGLDDAAEMAHTNSRIVSGSHALSYVGKHSNITDFTGYGQHLYYFPLFGLSSPESAQRTDDRDVYHQGIFREFEHHQLLSLETRTFSPDALGIPLGVKARGGYADWPIFTLPDGQSGRAGSVYDDATLDQNSNNTINQVITLHSEPQAFCLNIITDNTAGQNNPDARFEARLDSGGTQIDIDLADHTDFTFDGQPDMYTFLYEGMNEDERFKLRISTSNSDDGRGAGFGGIMVSEVSTCTPCVPQCDDKDCGDDSCGDSCGTCDEPDSCQAGICTEPSPVDAAVVAGEDAAVAGDDAGIGAESAGGCGCQSGTGKGGAWILILAALLAVRRRR